MRTFLITAAAFGLMAGSAVAQDEMMADSGLSLSGSAGMGLIWQDGAAKDDESRARFLSKFDIGFSGQGVTDGGLTFGAGATIEARGGQGQGSSTTDAEVYIGGEVWKVTVGDLDPATHITHNLPDVGFDGLGVDDIAEKAVDNVGSNALVELTFGLAKVQMSVAAVTPDAELGPIATTERGDGNRYVAVGAAPNAAAVANPNAIRVGKGGVHALGTTSAIAASTLKQKNEWAIGASFDIGPTTLALGANSGKQTHEHGDFKNAIRTNVDRGTVLKASVDAGLGMFDGGLFYSQQEVKTTETTATADNNDTQTNKITGLGAHFGVEVTEGTKITGVYTQSKHSDVNSIAGTGVISDPDTDGNGNDDTAVELGATGYTATSRTLKAFGVGVSHSLGGGATLQAGVAKVDVTETTDQTKFSVGVAMSF